MPYNVLKHAEGPLATDTLGTRTTTAGTGIAGIVAEETGLDPAYEYTGGERGWTGDVSTMHLSSKTRDAIGTVAYGGHAI